MDNNEKIVKLFLLQKEVEELRNRYLISVAFEKTDKNIEEELKEKERELKEQIKIVEEINI